MITVYEKTTCSKCRETLKILRDSGVPFKEVQYYETPLSKSKLKELLKKLNMNPRDLIRTGEKVYKELELSDKDVSDATLIEAMIENPDLIQRPIVEKGNRAIIGRPPEKVKEIL